MDGARLNVERAMMGALLKITAMVETATGVTLLAAPAWLVSILFGAPLDTPAGLIVARLAGVALAALGVACWLGSREAARPAASGMVAAMLVYNVGAVGLLLWARYGAAMTGMGLLPVALLHTVLAFWCILCLKSGES